MRKLLYNLYHVLNGKSLKDKKMGGFKLFSAAVLGCSLFWGAVCLGVQYVGGPKIN